MMRKLTIYQPSYTAAELDVHWDEFPMAHHYDWVVGKSPDIQSYCIEGKSGLWLRRANDFHWDAVYAKLNDQEGDYFVFWEEGTTASRRGEIYKPVEKKKGHDLHFISLISKFGFWDGDMFEEEWLEVIKDMKRPFSFGSHDILIEVVKRYVIPAIPFEVEYEVITTMHNPIRLTKIDGKEADYELANELFKDEKVFVSTEQVQEVIEDLKKKYE